MNSKSPPLLLHLAPGDAEPLREQIARALRDRIVRGELEAGDRLPGYRQLARQYRLSPSTVEAALEILVGEGLVAGEVSEELRVAPLSPEKRRELVEKLQIQEMVALELGRRELELARDVQRRLLPPSELAGPGWALAARCLPARVVAGDFYDVLQRADGSLDVVVADVAGKGFAAALIMASVKAMLPFVTAEGGVAEALSDLNRRLAPEFARGEFVALALARYHPGERRVELANAGAPDPYLVRPGTPPRALSVPGPRLPLGIRSEIAYASRTAELESGEGFLLLTDGLPEARGSDGEPIGYESLEETLGGLAAAGTPGGRLAELFEAVQERSGRLPDDDWTAALLVPGELGDRL
jgi:sigma-B regulation protein RsbU (phosphoserine phosphatase)